jgi:hypothetical protein
MCKLTFRNLDCEVGGSKIGEEFAQRRNCDRFRGTNGFCLFSKSPLTSESECPPTGALKRTESLMGQYDLRGRIAK